MATFLNWLPLLLRRRKREQALALAATWRTATAKLLKSVVIEKDPLAASTAFQDRQVEATFFFTIEGSYYGGHLHSVPMSESEAHRAVKLVPEDTPVQVRYNPTDPDQVHTLSRDNAGFPFAIWPS